MARAWFTQDVTASDVAVAPDTASTALLPEVRRVPERPVY